MRRIYCSQFKKIAKNINLNILRTTNRRAIFLLVVVSIIVRKINSLKNKKQKEF